MLLKTASSVALALIFAAAPALSADLGRHDAPADYVAGKPAFSGLGVGIHGGGQMTNVELGAGSFSFDGVGADGLVGGIHAEYLFALGGSFRVGPYVEGGFSNVNTNIEFGSDLDVLNQEHYYGAGIKAGAVFGSSLVYVRGGVERAKWDVIESFDADVDSLVLGGGVETMLTQNISIGLGVDYLTPLNIEAEGHDVTDLLDETESFRAMARLTWRQ